MTNFALQKTKEAEAKAHAAAAEQDDAAKKRTVTECSYAALVDVSLCYYLRGLRFNACNFVCNKEEKITSKTTEATVRAAAAEQDGATRTPKTH